MHYQSKKKYMIAFIRVRSRLETQSQTFNEKNNFDPQNIKFWLSRFFPGLKVIDISINFFRTFVLMCLIFVGSLNIKSRVILLESLFFIFFYHSDF